MSREVAGQHGRYVVEGELGAGAVGIVYRARCVPGGEPVAIKILRAPSPDAETRNRFEQEARLGESLTHESLVRVLDHGRHEGREFIVMQLVQGLGLDVLMQRGGLPLEEGVAIVARIARGLDAAHALGVVHRDVKPGNILVDATRAPFLTDFGFAKDLKNNFGLTRDQSVVGTPAYMAPEQARGQKVTPRADVYALGVILYELATGEVPFRGRDPDETLALVAAAPVPSPRRRAPDLPEWLEKAILRCLAKRPEDRFPTAGDLARILEDAGAAGDSPEGNRALKLAAGGLVAAGGVALAVGLGLAAGRAWSRPQRPAHDGDEAKAKSPPAPSPSPSRAAGPGAPALALALDLAKKGESERLVRAQLDRCLELEPGCPRALLEIAALDLARGDLAAARASLRRADDGGTADAEVRAVRDAVSRKIAAEAEAQDEVLARAANAVRDFRPRAALEALQPAAAARPGAARVQQAFALALALDGRGAEALERADAARRLDASVGEIFDLEERQQLEACAQQPALPEPEGWGRLSPAWQPLWGGSWLEKDGELLGRGMGAGAFDFAGLARADAAPAERCRIKVQVSLVSGQPGPYAGVFFGARSPRDFYLAYLFHDPSSVARFPREALEQIQQLNGGKPDFVRFARMVNGKWDHIGTIPARFPESGFIPFELEVGGRASVRATVNGTGYDVPLDRSAEGRVGLLKFYDTVVRFKEWELTPLP